MAEIIKVYKEKLPTLRFIGKRYTNADKDADESFGAKWEEWFSNNWFEELEKLGTPEGIDNDYYGFMRNNPSFEYWIGIFLAPGTAVPSGYDCIDVAEGEVGVCWIKGKAEDGSIFMLHDKCLETLKEKAIGQCRAADDSSAYYFERYNCPRFTDKDSDGNVILDYGIYLA